MKSLLIIANKNAGTRAVQCYRESKRLLWGWKTEICTPASQDELHETIRQLDPELYAAVITIGGDGTVNGALPALLGSKIPLLSFPAGTANDLACALGISPDWTMVQRVLDLGQVRAIDVITVNHVPFVTVGGIGLGAAMLAAFNVKRRTLGIHKIAARFLTDQVYGVLALQSILSGDYPQPKVAVRYDGQLIEDYVGSLLVCNQGTFGRDICISADSVMDDGKFEVDMLRPGTLHIARSLLSAKTSSNGLRGDHDFATSRMEVKSLSGENLCAFGDGEILVEDQVLVFEIKKQALLVYHGQGEK
jgi:diacylglycerol kinase family enzyme